MSVFATGIVNAKPRALYPSQPGCHIVKIAYAARPEVCHLHCMFQPLHALSAKLLLLRIDLAVRAPPVDQGV